MIVEIKEYNNKTQTHSLRAYVVLKKYGKVEISTAKTLHFNDEYNVDDVHRILILEDKVVIFVDKVNKEPLNEKCQSSNQPSANQPTDQSEQPNDQRGH